MQTKQQSSANYNGMKLLLCGEYPLCWRIEKNENNNDNDYDDDTTITTTTTTNNNNNIWANTLANSSRPHAL